MPRPRGIQRDVDPSRFTVVEHCASLEHDRAYDQLAIIAGAQARSPGAASELVRKAPTSSLRELAEEAARMCSGGEDADERGAAVHAAHPQA